MRCPYCGEEISKVIESRNGANGKSIRRRRECIKCKKRFTTYETIESTPIIVIKKDKSREKFSRSKLMNGIMTATEKRNISLATIENIVAEIEMEISNNLKGEINSNVIGKAVMNRLKKIDKVAYVRFASVYKEFKDLESFKEEIDRIQ